MSKEFDSCRVNGGKVKTISGPNKLYGLKAGEYMHVCIQGEKIVKGEVKRKKPLAHKLGI